MELPKSDLKLISNSWLTRSFCWGVTINR